MAKFTVRVELHGVGHDSEKYTQLHAEMEKRGFSRTIMFGKTTYELPTAEYSIGGTYTIDQVLERAKAAALAVMKSESLFSVLVTQTEVDRKAHNLKAKK